MTTHRNTLKAVLLGSALGIALLAALAQPSKAQDAGYFSRQTYTSTGSATYAVPFPYIDQSDVQVTANGVPYAGTVTWTSTGVISLSPIVPSGETVLLTRRTQIASPAAVFQGGPLASADLNANTIQILYSAQEQKDAVQFAIVNGSVTPPIPASSLAPGVAPIQCVNPSYFGASTNSSDAVNLSAYLAAYSTGQNICFSSGNFHFGATLPLGQFAGQRILGAGRSLTSLTEDNAAVPVITMIPFAQATCVEDLTVDRSVTATSGGDGIDTGAASQFICIRRTTSQHNWVGYGLHSAAWADSENNIAQSNLSHGFYEQTDNFTTFGSSAGGFQWNFTGQNLSQANAGDGFRFASTGTCPGTTLFQVTMNPLNAPYTFGNGGWGLNFLGAATCPIEDIQVNGGFLGTDALGEVNDDSYGTYAAFNGGAQELAGGGTLHTSPSMNFTANLTGPVRITGVDINSSGAQGIVSHATNTVITSSKVFAAGQAAAGNPLLAVGIDLFGANSHVEGGSSTGQSYGIIFESGATASSVFGTDLSANTVLPVAPQTDTTSVPANVSSGQLLFPGMFQCTQLGICRSLLPFQPGTTTISQITASGLYVNSAYNGFFLSISDRNSRLAYNRAGVWYWVSGDVVATTSN